VKLTRRSRSKASGRQSPWPRCLGGHGTEVVVQAERHALYRRLRDEKARRMWEDMLAGMKQELWAVPEGSEM